MFCLEYRSSSQANIGWDLQFPKKHHNIFEGNFHDFFLESSKK
jgi:hypothetical protein